MRSTGIVRVMSLDDEYRKPRNVPQLAGAVCIDDNTRLLRVTDRAGNARFWCGRGGAVQQLFVPGNPFNSQGLGFCSIGYTSRHFWLVRTTTGEVLRD